MVCAAAVPVVVVEGADVVAAVVVAEVVAPVVGCAGAVVVVDGASAGLDSAGLPRENSGVEVPAVCAGADVAVVACVVLGVVPAAVVVAALKSDGAAAGVDAGVVDEAVPPRFGNRGFCGVAIEAAFVEDLESPLAEGNEKGDLAVVVVAAPPPEDEVVVPPKENNGFDPLSEVVVVAF